VALVAGYDADTISSLPAGALQAQTLANHGASPEQIAGIYRLGFALTDADLRAADRAHDATSGRRGLG
jgi:hypothetical protein